MKEHIRVFTAAWVLLAACGGGTPPRDLRQAKVEIDNAKPAKTVALSQPSLNLVVGFARTQAGLWVLGSGASCLFGTVFPARCVTYPVELWDVEMIGAPRPLLVGRGGWGSPSVAVLDMAGRLLWRYDSKYQAMSGGVVVEDGSEYRVIVPDAKRGWVVFDLVTGHEITALSPPGELLGAADFNGDKRTDLLISRSPNHFEVITPKGESLARLQVDFDYWFKPVVTTDGAPHVVLSGPGVAYVYSGQLQQVARLDLPGMNFPLHVEAFVMPQTPYGGYVALVKGRGGWHKTLLYVFARSGTLLYKEVLDGDYQSLSVMGEEEGQEEILVGGRGKVLRYIFPRSS